MDRSFIYEDLSDSPMVFSILKYLIDNHQIEYIPYRYYKEPFVYRIELEDANRMDAPDILQKIRVMTIPSLILQEFQWLYTVLWSKNIIHGDLTNNNIIYQDGKFYFIDWELTNIVKGNMCGLWYIFADMIDFLNVYYKLLPGMYRTTYNTSKEEFDSYYNMIKGQEEIMKDNENINQCVQTFQINMPILQNFIAFIKRVSRIDLTSMINNVIGQNRIGGKRLRKQKKRRSTKIRSRRKRRKTKRM
jgi:tRNA A-37 threonylcarbamoyl transferase component Bud32